MTVQTDASTLYEREVRALRNRELKLAVRQHRRRDCGEDVGYCTRDWLAREEGRGGSSRVEGVWALRA